MGEINTSAKWQTSHKSKVAKLSFLLLLYAFGNHDGTISKFENKVFKLVIKNEKEHLLKDDLNKIILLSKNKVNRNTVHSFILQEQLSETIVNEAMDSVRKHFQSKPDYTLLLDSLFM